MSKKEFKYYKNKMNFNVLTELAEIIFNILKSKKIEYPNNKTKHNYETVNNDTLKMLESCSAPIEFDNPIDDEEASKKETGKNKKSRKLASKRNPNNTMTAISQYFIIPLWVNLSYEDKVLMLLHQSDFKQFCLMTALISSQYGIQTNLKDIEKFVDVLTYKKYEGL